MARETLRSMQRPALSMAIDHNQGIYDLQTKLRKDIIASMIIQFYGALLQSDLEYEFQKWWIKNIELDSSMFYHSFQLGWQMGCRSILRKIQRYSLKQDSWCGERDEEWFKLWNGRRVKEKCGLGGRAPLVRGLEQLLRLMISFFNRRLVLSNRFANSSVTSIRYCM